MTTEVRPTTTSTDQTVHTTFTDATDLTDTRPTTVSTEKYVHTSFAHANTVEPMPSPRGLSTLRAGSYSHPHAPPMAAAEPRNRKHFHDAEYAWERIRRFCQDGFSEFFGTMVLILFGDGAVAQVTLSAGKSGDYQSINWCWGSVLTSYLARLVCCQLPCLASVLTVTDRSTTALE